MSTRNKKPNNTSEKLTLVHQDYDSVMHHMKDLVRRIMNETAVHGFKDLFTDPVCREKIIALYEKRNERLMIEDKCTLLSLKKESIDVLIPERLGVRFEFSDTVKTRSGAIA